MSALLDQFAELDSYSVSSLKQPSADRHVAPLGHIILIPSQPVFALTPYCYVLSGEATHTNFIVFGLTRPRLETTTYRTRDEHANHYTTDAVFVTRVTRRVPPVEQELITLQEHLHVRHRVLVGFILPNL